MATYPQTEAEATDALTSLADEGPWLSALAAAHPNLVTVTQLGLSTFGNTPIRKVIIRESATPTPVAMFTGMVHGLEGGGREALFAFMRDLALSTDPEWVALRRRFTFVFIPSVNPSGFSRGTNHAWKSDTESREPQVDQLWMELNESKLLQEAFTLHQPVLSVDCHEHDSHGSAAAAMFGTSNPWLRDTSRAIFDAVMDAWSAAGVARVPYVEDPPSDANRSLRMLAEYRHSVTLLIETHRTKAPRARVADYEIALNALMSWLHTNADHLISTSGRSRMMARRAMHDRTIPLTISGDIRYKTWPLGYSNLRNGTTGNPLAWRPQFDSLGIVGTSDWVSLDQPNGYLAARVLHPGLFDPLATSTPHDPPGPPAPADGDVTGATVDSVPVLEASIDGHKVF